jgi:hypothetical protein
MWASDWPIIEDLDLRLRRRWCANEMKFFNADDLCWVLSGTIERVWKFAD